MSRSLSDIRKVENEVVFRKSNERAIQHLTETKIAAIEENDEARLEDLEGVELLFYCECLDDKCRERIPMTIKKYANARKNSKQFVLLPGHDYPEIEDIVFDGGEYIVVQKYMSPLPDANRLNPI